MPPTSQLLVFARELQQAATFEDLLKIMHRELSHTLGYNHAWLFVGDHENPEEMRLLDISGAKRGLAFEAAPVLKIKDDAMLEEIVKSDRPVVVADAQTDPRTDKKMVAIFGNRTIINVPLRLLDKPFGAFGTGTFGDEGCRPPSPQEVDYLIGMAAQLAVAAGRIRFLDERRLADARVQRIEEQLRQAQKMEAVGRLAGGVAHDFNNLLSVILSYSELLLDDLKPTDPHRREVQQILQAGERARTLTAQLLALSRQQVLEPRVIDLRLILSAMEAMLRTVAGEDIHLIMSVPVELANVFADPVQIEQIVVNLAINARESMPDGGTLTIELAEVELDENYTRVHVGSQPGPHVMLAVSDTGVGMSKAAQERVFDPFFAAKPNTKVTGLGLATVYGIVKQSGGSIWLYSEEGKGTTFKAYFPATLLPPASNQVRVPEKAALVGGAETILVVEDEPQVRELVCGILRRLGYRVLEAASAREALQLFEHATKIDLLLTDVVMQEMGGHELVRQITAQQPGVHVLFMSGYTQNAIVHHGVLDPGVFLLQKPITPEVLARKIRHMLDRRRR